MNSTFSFNNYNKIIYFSFLAVGSCPKNLAMLLPESWGLHADRHKTWQSVSKNNTGH